MKIPVLHRHKRSAQAFVRIAGQKPIYFGVWPAGCKNPPPEVDRKFKAWLATWLRNHAGQMRPVPIECPSVGELWARYHQHCMEYYRKRGEPTSTLSAMLPSFKILVGLFASLPAHEFGPEQLLQVRDEMIRRGWVRGSINDMVGRVRAMWKWAARVQQGRMVPWAVYAALLELEGLKAGRCLAPEGEGNEPVDMPLVETTLPYCLPNVAAMIQVHYLLACRSQDVVIMRPCDIDRKADPRDGLWLYTPYTSKVEHHIQEQRSRKAREAAQLAYWIVPRAQELLLPLILKAGGDDSESWVFACRARAGERGRYTTRSYRRHVARACAENGLEHWSPYQLRHTRLTEIGERQGTEKSQRAAGHKHLSTTEIYAAKRREEARRIMLNSERATG